MYSTEHKGRIETYLTAEQRYKAFLTKICEKREIDPTEAEQLKIVQEYKSWVYKEFENEHARKEGISETI